MRAIGFPKIAGYLRISLATVYRWVRNEPDFARLIRRDSPTGKPWAHYAALREWRRKKR